MKQRSVEWYQARIDQMVREQNQIKRLSVRVKAKEEKKKVLPYGKPRVKGSQSWHKGQEWIRYRRIVWQLTNKVDIRGLDNFHLRGFETYQLDHIVSVYDGFRHKLPPEWIADKSNLRIILATENILKGVNSIPECLKAMLERLNAV